MKQNNYDPNQYAPPQVILRPKAKRRRTGIKPGQTKIGVQKPTPIINYINIGLGITFGFLMLRTFVPDMNPFATIENNVLATFGHLRGTTVVFDWKTLADPDKIQKAMRGIPGSFIVTDNEGNILASKDADIPIESASVAKAYTTSAMLEKNPDKYLEKRSFERLNKAFGVSDNEYFDARAMEIGGVEYIQAHMRKVTGDNRITIGNGSGCPRLERPEGTNSCAYGTRFPGATQPTMVSAASAIKLQIYLEKQLEKRGLKYTDLAPEKNGTKLYGSRFNSTVYAKTGTIGAVKSLMGVVDGPGGERVKFAAFTAGDGWSKEKRIGVHVKVLNSVFPKN
jgi:hypothetical protein